MQIDITTRHFTCKNELQQFIYEKMDKIEKYISNIQSVRIVLLQEKRACKVELVVFAKQKQYIAKSYSSDFQKSIHMVIDKIINQSKKD